MAETLTGAWIGRYDYEGGGAVPFEARLTQDGTSVTASTVEPNTFAPGLGPELAGWLRGHVTADDLRLTKTYAFDQGGDPHYRGRVNAARTRIAGRWTAPDHRDLRGRFVMVRKPRAAIRSGRRQGVASDG